MATARRIERVRTVLSRRQPDLHVVLESATNAHNASAVLRTCDAAGVLHVHLVNPGPEAWPLNAAISTRADKWLDIRTHASLSNCLKELRNKRLSIAVTCLEEEAVDYESLDFTRPTAVVFGNESEGASREALELSDVRVKIPMLGMVQSLNLSVSVGVVLYEALKQRRAAGLLDRRRLSPREFGRLRRLWLAGATGSGAGDAPPGRRRPLSGRGD
ncbi:MAG: RNA methyltransferase [Candidatus Aminicenantes bacterium]|nr:RNA methyltransferase [Candidatus Aminicenantes bacterium]